MSEATRPWWDVAFAESYRTVYAHRSDADAEAEVAALLPRLRLAPGPVLDLGCGHGRHLTALRAAGIPAWGLDYSATLLADARTRPACGGRILRGDMRTPPLTDGWGAVLMLFTAFGYFDDNTNTAVLAAWANRLAPGGWLVVDLPDPERLANRLCPCSERAGDDGSRIREERRLQHHRVEKTVTITRADATTTSYTESVRLYRPDEFAALAVHAGLAVNECWPGLRGPDQDDGRLVWWLRRELA